MSTTFHLPALSVVGHGFFSTHYATAIDAKRGVPCEGRKPKFELLVARARRFTSLVTQMHVEVCGQALAQHPPSAELRPHGIFASHHGELQIAADLVSDLLTLKSVSSARFALSVHNAPSGLFSIATKNTRSSTTVAAGEASFAAGLLEAFLIAQERTLPVLLSYADEPIPAIFGGAPGQVGTAFALLLVPRGQENGSPSKGTIQLDEYDDAGSAKHDPMQAAIEVASAIEEGRAIAAKGIGRVRKGAMLGLTFHPLGARP